jgi:very-short-patch-repair endonuclease
MRSRPLTQEEIERLFLDLCDRGGLARPRTQAAIELAEGDTIYADFLWPEHMLIVEADGREAHATRNAFERDRRRDRRALLLGYRVARFTWRDVAYLPDEVASTLSALLAPSGCP